MKKAGGTALASESLDYNEEIDWNAEFRDDDDDFDIGEDIDAKMDAILNGKNGPLPSKKTESAASILTKPSPVSKPVFPQLQQPTQTKSEPAKGMMRLTKSTDKEKEKVDEEPFTTIERPASPSKDKVTRDPAPKKPAARLYSIRKPPIVEDDEGDEEVSSNLNSHLSNPR